MRYISILITMLFISLFLSSCGTGGTSEKGNISTVVVLCDNSNSATATNDCGDSSIPDYYTCLKDGDTLIEDDANSIVKIIHTPTNKKVCVQSGTAHIIR